MTFHELLQQVTVGEYFAGLIILLVVLYGIVLILKSLGPDYDL